MKTIVCGRWNRHSSARVETKTLWSARNKYDEGKVGFDELYQARQTVTALILKELEGEGVDILGDFSLHYDSIFDIARGLTDQLGFDQLARIRETNHFHRQWRSHSARILPKNSLLGDDLDFAKKHSVCPIVVSLPGPYSLARQTQNVEEIGLEKLACGYSYALNKEINRCLNHGAFMVRIEDPLILAYPDDWGFYKRAVTLLADGVDVSRLALATWYGDVSKLPDYFELPFGLFWLDFVEGKGNFQAIEKFPKDKKLIAGLFDARQTHEEDFSELARQLGEIRRFVDEDHIYLSANTDLHFLPWDKALTKVKRLVEFSQKYEIDWYLRILKAENHVISQPGHSSTFSIPKKELTFLEARQLFANVSFPTSTVGSFPQPEELRRARVKLRKGELTPEDYGKLVEKHTRAWMQTQEQLDITLPVTGEFSREDMAAFYGRHFNGRLLDFVPSYENRRYRPVEYFETIRAQVGATVPDFIFGQSLTSRPLKETITGPATLADWALIRDERYYEDRRAFRMDLARALRQEIDALVASGVKFLQIDEPALTTKMRNFAFDLEAIYETMRGLEDNVYLILHICYSDMAALDEAFPQILRLPFHQIHLEMANRGYSLMKLIEKYGFAGKDIGLGVIDVHTNRIEKLEEIVRGVEGALAYFKPEQIWLTPDCGLKERSETVSKEKLLVMSAAAEICREKFV